MKVLHVLAQRPSLTGSGVTLAELCRHAGRAGWEQHVVCGLPADAPVPPLPGVAGANVSAVRFGAGALDFDVPGMSDVMPYPSSRWRDLDEARLTAYRDAWRTHLERVVAATKPDVIHSHHLWLVSTIAADVAARLVPDARLVVHGHATGLRQMEFCPHLADEVRAGLTRADAVLALHETHARAIADVAGVDGARVHVVGVGYAESVYHARGRRPSTNSEIAYAGKLAAAKGVPWLLDAFARVRQVRPDARLHLLGGGGGDEGAKLASRASAQDGVVLHGRVDELELADVLRSVHVLVLPSFYEGLPLVLIEARACGCRLVSTELPGVTAHLASALGDALHRVPLPRLRDVDAPLDEDLPRFVSALEQALLDALDRPLDAPSEEHLAPFRWSAVFDRIERIWRG